APPPPPSRRPRQTRCSAARTYRRTPPSLGTLIQKALQRAGPPEDGAQPISRDRNPLEHTTLLQLPEPLRPAAAARLLEWADLGNRFAVPGDGRAFATLARGAHDL